MTPADIVVEIVSGLVVFHCVYVLLSLCIVGLIDVLNFYYCSYGSIV